jgi:hypothetical protein
MSDLGARTLQDATTYDLWSAGYTLWLAAERYLDGFC